MATQPETTTWAAPPPTEPKVHTLVEKLEGASAIDPPAKTVAKAVRSAVPAGGLKDLLSGKPIGHALHPLLTDVVIGAYTSAIVLDAIGGEQARPAASKLIATGLAATPGRLKRAASSSSCPSSGRSDPMSRRSPAPTSHIVPCGNSDANVAAIERRSAGRMS